MFSSIDNFELKIRDESAAFQSIRLGNTTNPFNTNSFTAVQALPRVELNRGKMPDLVGGYSSLGFDINPLDISYRAEEKVDYYIDFGSALVRVAWAANNGGASEAAKTIGKQNFVLFS